LLFVLFTLWVFYWALFYPKEDPVNRFSQTLKEQEKKADLSFVDVSFEEVSAGVKYWQLNAKFAKVNKSAAIAALKESTGTFFKNGKAVLRFNSPAAIWDMKKKEIYLDHPLGYDISLERKIASLVKSLKNPNISIFSLPKIYKKGAGYWFQANNLSWRLADQKLLCSGKIILNKGEVTGYAEKLEGDVALEKIRLQGNPTLVVNPDKSYPVTLEASIFEVISSQNVILARKNPRIRWGEALIYADDLKYLQASEILELTGKVRIFYKDIFAQGETAKYLTSQDKIIVEGKAYAEQGENKLSGNSVSVSLKDKKISVLGKGKVIIPEKEFKK
jgi:lipopolysaccharide export system protein LptA